MQPQPAVVMHQLAPGPSVHRRQLREVLVGPAFRQTSQTFAMGSQWPREHRFYSTLFRRPDSALVAETVRQATILIAHTMYDVPLASSFLMPSMSIRTWLPADPWDQDQLLVRASTTRVARSGNTVSGLQLEVSVHAGEQTLGAGVGNARIVSAEAYARMRRGRPRKPSMASGMPPGLKQPLLQWRTGTEAMITVDDTDPVFFDHPLDHVPGMLLLEAARQGVQQLLGSSAVDLTTCELTFHRIAEFEPQLSLRVAATTTSSVEFAVWQNDEVCVTGTAVAGSKR